MGFSCHTKTYTIVAQNLKDATTTKFSIKFLFLYDISFEN